MDYSPLTAISPIDGRYHNKCETLAPIFSEYGLIHNRLKVEIHWLFALCENRKISECPKLSKDDQQFLLQLISNFSVTEAKLVKQHEATTNHDVKAVEYYLKDKFAQRPTLLAAKEFIHFACTSEDINNLAYALMLKEARDTVLFPQLQHTTDTLTAMAKDYADYAMLSRTHGQSASPTTLGKELMNVVQRLQRQITQLSAINIMGKMNGAVGNYNAHLAAYPNVDWPKLSQQFVQTLGLDWQAYTTQIEPHDYIAELCDCLARINTILIDFCRDTWAYVSLGYYQQGNVAGEVGSSTMPHKINPIDFENAEGNLGLANALLQFFARKLPISRWQRDLTDSTVLRNLGSALAYCQIALKSLDKGLGRISANREAILADLQNHPEVLAEAIQTVLRRYDIEAPYEQLKALTRGNRMELSDLRQFIQQTDLPDDAKSALLELKPEDYLGYAVKLATGS